MGDQINMIIYKRMKNMIDKMDFIVRIRFIAWIAYSLASGQQYNEKITKDQYDSLLDAVKFSLANPDNTPELNHKNWMKMKVSQGWKYGLIKDLNLKTHPDLVPYDELPLIEKQKDEMDKIINKVALELYSELFEKSCLEKMKDLDKKLSRIKLE
jgi:hypothetical protein